MTKIEKAKALGFDVSTVKGYLSLLSGSAGRILISMGFFIAIANALTLEDFGIFSTATAIGVVLSRLSSFGFISPLYRTATVRPRLIGAFTAGYVVAFLLSMPVVALAAYLIFNLLFVGKISLLTFAGFIAAEAVFWRLLETVIIVNVGLGNYGRGAMMTIFGTAGRAFAAIVFWIGGTMSLDVWAQYLVFANVITLLISYILFYPRQKWRWRPAAYLGRMRDALSVTAADILFYLQSELDKVLVLAIGGELTAGLYNILMRLIDLTALPVRAFNTMLVQKVMRDRGSIAGVKTRILTESAIAFISIGGMLALAILLSIAPNALGKNIATAAGFVFLVLLVPAFRNLVEYHAELLYAREQTFERAIMLAIIAALKAGLLYVLLYTVLEFYDRALWLNALFGALYVASALITYGIMLKRPPPKRKRRKRRPQRV